MSKRSHHPAKNQSKTTWYWWVAGVVGVALIILAITTLLPRQNKTPDTVTVQDAAQLVEQGAFLLDVREPDEWDQVHVDGATLIPLGQLQARSAEVPKDRMVVVMCRTGVRSAQGRDILRAAGWENVTSVAGGINAWQAAGLPVVTGQ